MFYANPRDLVHFIPDFTTAYTPVARRTTAATAEMTPTATITTLTEELSGPVKTINFC